MDDATTNRQNPVENITDIDVTESIINNNNNNNKNKVQLFHRPLMYLQQPSTPTAGLPNNAVMSTLPLSPYRLPRRSPIPTEGKLNSHANIDGNFPAIVGAVGERGAGACNGFRD